MAEPAPRLVSVPAGWMLAALAVGMGGGALLAGVGWQDLPAALAVAEPVGRLWLDALTMTIVPMVFALIVTGIAGAAAEAGGSAVAARAIGWFAALLLLCGLTGAAFVWLFVAAVPVPAGAAALLASAGEAPALATGAEWYAGLLANPVASAAGGAMLPLVIFALLFGLAVTRIAPELRDAVTTPLRALAEAMLLLVRWVLLLAPAGIAALAFGIGARAGGAAVGTLAHYVVAVAGACLTVLPIAVFFAATAGRMAPGRFVRAALPAQAVALGTQSSLATLPAMLAAARRLEVPPAVAGLVLPLAVSLFRAASSAGNAAVALYLAHLHGLSPGIGMVAAAAIVSAAVSLAAVGGPSQVSFFTATAPVCLALGVPIVMLPLLLAIETIPDLFRTLGNVTADMAVARVAGRGAGLPQPGTAGPA